MGLFDRMFGGPKRIAYPPALAPQIEKAMNHLGALTAAHDGAWQLGQADWSVDQDVGTIEFTSPKGIRAVAPVQIVGTYDTEQRSWLWGWDHPSVAPALAADAKHVLAFGREHGSRC